MRLKDAELELLKSVFAGRDELLLLIRNVFYGFDLSEDERKSVEAAMTPSLLRLMRKQFLPEFQPDVPIGQNIDMYAIVDIRGKTKEQIYQEVESTTVKIALIEQGLARLARVDGPKPSLEFSRNELETNLAGRNLYLNHVDRQLQTIEVLAGQKTETVEETKARLLKDSAK